MLGRTAAGVPARNRATRRAPKRADTDISVSITEMSVLPLIEACANARTIAGLEHALTEHLGAPVRIAADGTPRTRSRKVDLDTLRRVVRVQLEHIAVLARVAELNRRATEDQSRLRDEVRRIALPIDVVAMSPELRRIFDD